MLPFKTSGQRRLLLKEYIHHTQALLYEIPIFHFFTSQRTSRDFCPRIGRSRPRVVSHKRSLFRHVLSFPLLFFLFRLSPLYKIKAHDLREYNASSRRVIIVCSKRICKRMPRHFFYLYSRKIRFSG
jgi:hypothetical protein